MAKVGCLLMPIRSVVIGGTSLVLAFAAQAQDFEGRQTVESFWQSKGVSPEVAAGIADRVQAESGFDPTIKGDGGTSLGLYMHHSDRMKTLLASIENDQAWHEVMGDDPIAAKHWAEIRAAPTRDIAAVLWGRYFERSAKSKSGVQSSPRVSAAAVPKVKQGPVVTTNPFLRPAQTMPAMMLSTARQE